MGSMDMWANQQELEGVAVEDRLKKQEEVIKKLWEHVVVQSQLLLAEVEHRRDEGDEETAAMLEECAKTTRKILEEASKVTSFVRFKS